MSSSHVQQLFARPSKCFIKQKPTPNPTHETCWELHPVRPPPPVPLLTRAYSLIDVAPSRMSHFGLSSLMRSFFVPTTSFGMRLTR